MHSDSELKTHLVEALHAQHLRLDAQLTELQQLVVKGDRDDMRSAWARLEDAVLAHLDLEEMHLLPVVARVSAEHAQHVRAEHDTIREELGAIGVALDLHAVRADQIERLAARLRSHASAEERGLYPEAARDLGPAARRSILRRIVGDIPIL